MSDLEKLLEKFERGELLRPDPDLPNVVDLARALANLAGVELCETTPGVSKLRQIIGPSDHLVFVLADGLGLNLLDHLPPDSFLSSHVVTELRSIFPSTTAAVLTTYATGEWPNQHGVTGQWTHLPEIEGSAALLPFAARSGGRSLTQLGVTIDQAFPLPPLMSKMRRDVLALFPSRLVNSVTSVYFSGSQPRFGYETFSEAADVVLARINAAQAPTYTYLYTPWIDSETHWLGVKHDGVRGILSEVSRVIERLAVGLGGRGRIVLSADHGLLDASVSARFWIRPTGDFFSTLRFTPSGDDRVLYFHLHAGVEDRFRHWLKAQYDDRFLSITVSEAEQLQLFGPGPISPRVRERFGDLVLISSGSNVIEYVPKGRIGRRVDLNAFHSGLSPAEMRVPLIIV